jgi:hypothetical protein
VKIDSVILVLLAVAAMFLWGRERERAGVLRAENAHLLQQSAKADTVYIHKVDTLRLTRRVTDSILTTDTVFHRDTVRLWLAAERNACDQALSACDTQKALLNLRIQNLEAARPSWLQKQLGHLPYLAAGVVAGAVLVK